MRSEREWGATQVRALFAAESGQEVGETPSAEELEEGLSEVEALFKEEFGQGVDEAPGAEESEESIPRRRTGSRRI